MGEFLIKGFPLLLVFIVRWRENQFNLEENERNVEKLTAKFRLPTVICRNVLRGNQKLR